MKAIVVRRFGPPSVMRLEDVPTPDPGPGDVLIRVATVSVNPTLDCAARAGTYSRPIPLPFTPGADPAGTVAAIGAGVTQFAVGDRVVAKLNVGGEARAGEPNRIGGGYAEFACARASMTTHVPEGLGFAEATVVSRHVPLALTLLRDRGAVAPGEWVLVMGAAGGLGSAGVQVAKYLGARVIAAAGSDERVRIGLALGADAGLNYRAEDVRGAISRITGGAGVDVVFENIGEPELFSAVFETLARNGRLVTVGTHGGGRVQLDVTRLYQRALTVTGTTAVAPDDVRLSLDAAARGQFRAVIDRVMPLSDAVAAHELAEARGSTGKIVLTGGSS